MKTLFYILLIIVTAYGCRSDKGDQIPNVSNIDVDFEVYRIDQVISQLDTNNLGESLTQFISEYPLFSNLYFSRILNTASPQDNPIEFGTQMENLLTNRGIRYLMQSIDTEFNDFSSIRQEFKSAYQYLKYYFPEAHTPDVYTLLSEYGTSNFIFSDKIDRDAIGIGLDFYLGSDYPYNDFVPNHTSFSKYLTRSFNKEHFLKKSLIPIIEDKIPRQKGMKLMDKMIYEGKKLYMLKKLLPHTSDTIIFEYTATQLKFCQENEASIWSFFLNEELLYSVEPFKIRKYIEPAPNSSGMPEAAPGRTASYIGYQIIKQYMRRHPDLSLSELINLDDSQKILTASKFRPRTK